MPDFYLPQSKPTSTTSTTEDDTNIFDPETDVDSLPFPAPLSRATFSDPSFSPTTFLSSLSDRHQSLSDLQAELQDLSKSLAAELLDLVNANYQSFLHLGTALTGGDEKCEEVRMGVLGFQRDVGSVRASVEARENEVRALLEEKRRVRGEMLLAGELLGVGDAVEELEGKLMLEKQKKDDRSQDGDGDGDSEDDDDDGESDEADTESEEDTSSGISLRSLERSIHKYKYTCVVTKRIGETHPFIQSLQPRLNRIRDTLALDLKMVQRSLDPADANDKKRGKKVEELSRMLREENEDGLVKGVEGMNVSVS